MARRRKKRTPTVGLPDPAKILKQGWSSQMSVYSKAREQLDPHRRGELRRQGRSLFPEDEVRTFIAELEAGWEAERANCRDHPDYFKWPSTQVWFGNGEFAPGHMEAEGALKLFGYAVSAEAALSEMERRCQLDTVFGAVIPPFAPWHVLQEWGEPKSASRLEKMANCLASFARNGARRTEQGMALPVRKWTEDLEYLRIRYYQGHFGFGWPSP